MTSDGTLRFLALTLLAYLPSRDDLYLLEDPKNGVHPLALDAVYDSLASVYDSQVLVATHSPTFLQLAGPEQVLCFAKDDEGTTHIIRGDKHPHLKDWHGTADNKSVVCDRRHLMSGKHGSDYLTVLVADLRQIVRWLDTECVPPVPQGSGPTRDVLVVDIDTPGASGGFVSRPLSAPAIMDSFVATNGSSAME